jgi:CO/xanthine dehydrogenase Mo-binding subunit
LQSVFVRVHRVVSAIDPGHVVNPLSIEMQTEGAIVYALTAALYGEIKIKDGAVEQANFDTHRMLRIDGVRVETVIVPSGGRRRRAAGASDGAGARQRDLRRHRNPHPLAATNKPLLMLTESKTSA